MIQDDAAQELPQRSLPRFSIRWMIGLVTVTAVFFTVCQYAANGSRWAQVIVLGVGIAIAPRVAYAAFFLIGLAWDSAFTRRDVTDPPLPKNDEPAGLDKPAGSDSHEKTHTIAAWMVAAFFAASGSISSADVNWLATYPGGTNALDYRLQVGMEEQLGQGGYINLHLKFTPTRGVFTAKHDLTVSVSSHTNYKTQLAAATSESFTLEQSAKSTTYHMLVPYFEATRVLKIWITEDGKEVHRDRSSLSVSNKDFIYNGQRWTIGVIHRPADDPPFPDLRSMLTIFGGDTVPGPITEETNKQRLSNQESRIFATQTQPAFAQFRVIEPKDIAPQWLAFSDLDLIMVDASLWSDWIVDPPPAADSLKKFAAAGGVLLIYGDDSAIQATKASIDSVSVGDTETDSASESAFTNPPNKLVPKPSRVIRQLQLAKLNDTSPVTHQQWDGTFIKRSQQYGNDKFRSRQVFYDKLVKAGSAMTRTLPPKKLAGRIEVAKFGLGKVVLIHDKDPFPGSFQFWMTLQAALLEKPAAKPWIERHGVEYRTGNTNYWRWLIESVGGPPVKMFVILNTLFVLIVGPIAYWILRRLDRLYLLYFGAPALAVLITVGLFGFAVFSDGVGTKLRTHQWTWVDGANEVVVHQDRSTVYSSFGTDSLRFDRQSLVLPVLPTGNQDYSHYPGEGAQPKGRVQWTGDSQYWSGEFLPTRSQVQYQVTRPEIGVSAPLTFETDVVAGQVFVRNNSEQAIGPLVYCDSKSAFHFIDRVAVDESVLMQPSSQQAVRDLVSDKELPPVGFIPSVRSNWTRIYNGSSPGDDRPLPERLVEQWMRRLPKNAFIALSEVDQSRFPVDEPQVSIATHIILGTAK